MVRDAYEPKVLRMSPPGVHNALTLSQPLTPPPPRANAHLRLPDQALPRSLSQPVSDGKLFMALPVLHGVFFPMKDVERRGHP